MASTAKAQPLSLVIVEEVKPPPEYRMKCNYCGVKGETRRMRDLADADALHHASTHDFK